MGIVSRRCEYCNKRCFTPCEISRNADNCSRNRVVKKPLNTSKKKSNEKTESSR